jgi:hypothetical protein
MEQVETVTIIGMTRMTHSVRFSLLAIKNFTFFHINLIRIIFIGRTLRFSASFVSNAAVLRDKALNISFSPTAIELRSTWANASIASAIWAIRTQRQISGSDGSKNDDAQNYKSFHA